MLIAPPCLVNTFAASGFIASATASAAPLAEYVRGNGKLSRSTTTKRAFNDHGMQGEHT